MNQLENKRVILVNTVVGTGSVGRLTEGLYHALCDKGYECLVAHGRGNAPKDVNAYRIDEDIEVYVHGAISRLTDRHGFYSARATKKFIKKIEEFKPDIIHLHNVHGYYLHLGILFEYLKKTDIRLIWTLHDCWSFTGHCSHFEYIGCDKWLTGCHDCEQLSEYPKTIGKDSSCRNYLDKKMLFTGFDNLTLVTSSNWLKSQVEKSFMKEYQTVVLPTGIDLKKFKPVNDTDSLRQKLGLEGKTVILGVANPWRDRKGLALFVKLANMLDESFAIVMIGLSDIQKKSLPSNIIGIGHSDQIEELAAYYSMADIYVNLTLEDTFPTTNIEALACGTPVITYNSGGSIESIDDTCGISIDDNSLEGVVDAIKQMVIKKETSYGIEDCLKRAGLYDKEYRFEEYIREVYE